MFSAANIKFNDNDDRLNDTDEVTTSDDDLENLDKDFYYSKSGTSIKLDEI